MPSFFFGKNSENAFRTCRYLRLLEGSLIVAKLNPRNVRFGLGHLVEGSLFVAKLNLRNVRFGHGETDLVYA
jgi:hypothetical protein